MKITPARVVSGGSTYAVANITSVRAQTDTSARTYGILAVVVGILVAATGSTGAIVLGLMAVIVGILMAVLGPYSEVVITTGAAEQKAFRSRKEKLVLEVASAINLAIIKRSVTMGR